MSVSATGKVVLVHVTKWYGAGGILPRIPNLGGRWR